MKKNMPKRILTLLLTTFLFILMIPVSVSAASKRKLLKTEKYYDQNNKLIESVTLSYDKKGKLKKYTDVSSWPGSAKQTHTQTYKYTYRNKKKGTLKKLVIKGTFGKTVETYNKKGLLTKSVYTPKSGEKTTATYAYKGKKLKSRTEKNASGKMVSYDEFDSHGYIVLSKWYDDNGKVANTETTKNTYKKGVLRKSVTTSKYWNSTMTYDKHGELTKNVVKNSTGETYTTVYKNTYKKGYLTKKMLYTNGKFSEKQVFTYTKKKY